MTPYEAYKEFDDTAWRMYGQLSAIHGEALHVGEPHAVGIGAKHLFDTTEKERQRAAWFLDLARFLQVIMNFEGFYRGVMAEANRAKGLGMAEQKIERLPVSGKKEKNFATVLRKHLGIAVSKAAYYHKHFDRWQTVDTSKLLEYWQVRHRWMHQAGRIDDGFLTGDVARLHEEGWFEGLDRCWVRRVPPNFTSPLEQVVWDVNGLAGWIAEECEKDPDLKGKIME